MGSIALPRGDTRTGPPQSPARALTHLDDDLVGCHTRHRNAMVYLIFFVALVIVAIGPIWFWARRIEKRIEPPEDRPGHESARYHFDHGAEPPGEAGSGTISGVS